VKESTVTHRIKEALILARKMGSRDKAVGIVTGRSEVRITTSERDFSVPRIRLDRVEGVHFTLFMVGFFRGGKAA
jgi:hypothetical protein